MSEQKLSPRDVGMQLAETVWVMHRGETGRSDAHRALELAVAQYAKDKPIEAQRAIFEAAEGRWQEMRISAGLSSAA
jgi:hypothetical protein